MRIAAGIFLIITAIINLIGGALAFLGGGAMSVGASAAEELQAQGGAVDAAAQANLAEASATGGAILGLGIFLLVVSLFQIVGAVQTFRTKAATLVMVVGVLSLIAEVAGIVVVKFGVMNIPGIIAGALAIVAGLQIKKAAEGAGATAPPAGAAA